MNTKTEGDIPELFQQFNGNSANYQELTRAAAARASQARWPLLSAVELEQGDIPSVIDAVTGLAVVEPVLMEVAREVALDAQAAALSMPAAKPEGKHDTKPKASQPNIQVDAIPVVAPTADAQAVIAAETEAGTDVAAAAAAATDTETGAGAAADSAIDTAVDSRPEMPSAVVLPGNTIFMAPAPYSARHFAQLERGLVARREAALAEIVASTQAPSVEPSLESLLAATQEAAMAESLAPVLADSGVDTVAEPVLASTDAALPQALAEVIVIEVAKIETAKIEVAKDEAIVPNPFAAATIPPQPAKQALAARIAPAAETAVDPAPTVATAVTAARQPVTKPPITRPPTTRQPITRQAVAKPLHTAATPVATPPAPKAAAVVKSAAAPVASATPPTPAPPAASAANSAAESATESATTPVANPAAKHTGLKPLFERLAAPEEIATPVMSLFSRLMQS